MRVALWIQEIDRMCRSIDKMKEQGTAEQLTGLFKLLSKELMVIEQEAWILTLEAEERQRG